MVKPLVYRKPREHDFSVVNVIYILYQAQITLTDSLTHHETSGTTERVTMELGVTWYYYRQLPFRRWTPTKKLF